MNQELSRKTGNKLMMDTLYKADIVSHLNKEVGFTIKDANEAVEEIFGYIEENVAAGHEIQLTGFGKFGTRTRPATTRNVFGETKSIPAKTIATFKAGRSFREAVNG